ncbi:MerR family transcriptional regulator [Haloglycomyces albus]|uniref:MerR family transcriptional regulator n=1 Tax=Haloglycomyces albus TaxID=526067 RepID=UPI00046C9664|nr:MerR family transcriptional regulator [Haloglycomyces albus]
MEIRGEVRDPIRVIRGWRGRAACRAVGITYRQLDYWARTGLVQPSVRQATGSGSNRLYSFRDVVFLKVIKRLLDAGVSLGRIRMVVDLLHRRGVKDLSEVTLLCDGSVVHECRTAGEVIDLIKCGQGVFGISIKQSISEVMNRLSTLSCAEVPVAPPEQAFVPPPVGVASSSEPQ